MKKKLKAFTLAEVLITLAIVGVVAAITMPALIANIQERVKTARIQNIKQKFSKATDKMKSLSSLDGYATTMDFVNELQKHLKIAKVCDNQHLTECWPTEKVILDDEGKEWEISKTKTGKQLKMTNDDTHEYGDTVGIVTADGTAMILAYNAKCDLDKTTISWSGEQSSTTGCVAAVFDWNGSKMPNQLSNDVITFNSSGLGERCAFEIDDSCYLSAKFISLPLTNSECEAIKDSHGIKRACNNYNSDYWAAAVKECGHVDNLISAEHLAAMAEDIYGFSFSSPSVSFNDGYKEVNFNETAYLKYGIPNLRNGRILVWMSKEGSFAGGEGAYARAFSAPGSGSWLSYHGYYSKRTNEASYAICKGE